MRLMGFPRLIVLCLLVLGFLGLSLSFASGQGTGGGAVITVTVLSSDGGPVSGASVSGIDGDSPPTIQGPSPTDGAGQLQLVNFVLGDQVTISAQPPPGVTVSGMTTTIFVAESPMAVTLTLGPAATAPTPTPIPFAPATVPPALPPTATPLPAGTTAPGTGMTVRTVDPNGAALPGAGYTVYLPDSTSTFALDGDDGASDGITTFQGLPIGAAVAVSQTTTPGDAAAANNQTTVLTSFSGANVLTFTNYPLTVATEPAAEAQSQVSVRALLCESADLTGNTEYTVGADVIAPESCPPADGVTFSFTREETGQSVAAAAVFMASTDATGVASALLPAGAYTVGNELVAGTTPLTVDGVSVYHVTAVIYLSAGFVTPTPTPPANALTPPARETGDAQISVMVCTNPAQSGSVEFQVGVPGSELDVTGMTARIAAAIPAGCSPSAAVVTILPFSDPSAVATTVNVGATGFVVLDDLASTVDREPHLLRAVAANGDYEAPFDISPGAMTEIIVRVYLGGATPPPAGTPDVVIPAIVAPPPAASDGTGGAGGYAPRGGSSPSNGPYVTNLPVTGTGESRTAPVAFLLLTMVTVATLAAIRRRSSRAQ